MMIVDKKDICSLIPQKPPFVMIDGLIDVDTDYCTSVFTINDNCLLTDNGLFQESGLIENVAQTAAAGLGYESKSKNEGVETGFIGAVKNMVVYKLPIIGDTLETKTETLNKIMSAIIVKGTVKCNGEVIFECNLNVFFINNEDSNNLHI